MERKAPPAAAGPHRLFFALWPDDDVRARLINAASSVERDHAPGGRPVRAGRYHVTLRFLGQFSPLRPETVEAACAAAARVAFEPFELVLDRVGSFARSRVWWLGCSEVPDPLQRLHDALAVALAEEGFAPDVHPGFTPHLTIRRDARRGIGAVAVPAIRWPVESFVLVDSDPRLGYVHRAGWGAGWGPG